MTELGYWPLDLVRYAVRAEAGFDFTLVSDQDGFFRFYIGKVCRA